MGYNTIVRNYVYIIRMTTKSSMRVVERKELNFEKVSNSTI